MGRRVVALSVSLLLSLPVVLIASVVQLAAAEGPCIGDGVSGKRIHLWYAWQTEDRYAADVEKIRAVVAEADAKLAAIGGQHFRFLCSGGAVVVSKVRTSRADMDSFKSALRARGYTSTSRIYNGFLPQGTFGKGESTKDDRADPRVNVANVGPRYSAQPISVTMFLHEIAHNLGAVQPSAPHSSGYSHCWDQPDVMCYDDGGPYFQRGGSLQTRCAAGLLVNTQHFDCNRDDYYNPSPRAGSYLATHWNLRNSYFLTSPPSPPPAPGGLSMSDNTASSISLRWNSVYDPDGISAYALEMRRSGNADWSSVCQTTGRTCTASGSALWGGRSFEFRVHARDGAGTWGRYSDAIVAGCATSVCV